MKEYVRGLKASFNFGAAALLAICLFTPGIQTAEAQFGISLGSGFQRSGGGPSSGPLSTSGFMQETERMLQDQADRILGNDNVLRSGLFRDLDNCLRTIGEYAEPIWTNAEVGAKYNPLNGQTSGFIDWGVDVGDFRCVAGFNISSQQAYQLSGQPSSGLGSGSISVDFGSYIGARYEIGSNVNLQVEIDPFDYDGVIVTVGTIF